LKKIANCKAPHFIIDRYQGKVNTTIGRRSTLVLALDAGDKPDTTSIITE
jgi:hypothetical protein